MEAKHTSGPWGVAKRTEDEYGDPSYLISGAKKMVGDLTQALPKPIEEREANVRLITLAPEMLEALQFIAFAEDTGLLRLYVQDTESTLANRVRDAVAWVRRNGYEIS